MSHIRLTFLAAALSIFSAKLLAVEPEIKVTKASDAARVPSICRGFPDMVKEKLKAVGFSAKEIANGVPCIAQDYDGDGSRDYAVFRQIPNADDEASFDWKIPLFLNQKGHFKVARTLELGTLSRRFEACPRCCESKQDAIHEQSGGDINGTYCYGQEQDKWDRLPFW